MGNIHFTAAPGGGSGSGDATAENQVIEIGYLFQILSALTNPTGTNALIGGTNTLITALNASVNSIIGTNLAGGKYIKAGTYIRDTNVATGGNFLNAANQIMVIAILSQATRLPITLAAAVGGVTTGLSEVELDFIQNNASIGYFQYPSISPETVSVYSNNAKSMLNMLQPVHIIYLQNT